MNKDNNLGRYFDIHVPVTTCNLECDYCYIAHKDNSSVGIRPLNYSLSHIRKALSRERLGGTCLLNFCGAGETLLAPYIVTLTREMLEEGHYVMIVTNGLPAKRIRELTEEIPEVLRKHLILKISFHFTELKKKGLLEHFFANVRLIERSGISFTVELTPSDDEIPYIEEIKDVCIKNLGALCHVTVARDDSKPGIPILSALSREEFVKTWGQFDSPLFDFKMQIFGHYRKEFCYNGLWGGCISLDDGSFSQCYGLRSTKIFDNLSAPIDFCPVGNCEKAHCFNGHSWLTLGTIPELITPTYLEMRDRVTVDGRHWIGEDMRLFLSQKLSANNEALSSEAKQRALRRNRVKKATYYAGRILYYLVNGKWSILRKRLHSFVRR